MFFLLGCCSCGWFAVIRPCGAQRLMLPITHWQGGERRKREVWKRWKDKKRRGKEQAKGREWRKDKMRGDLKKCLVKTLKHFLVAMMVPDNDLDCADGQIQTEYSIWKEQRNKRKVSFLLSLRKKICAQSKSIKIHFYLQNASGPLETTCSAHVAKSFSACLTKKEYVSRTLYVLFSILSDRKYLLSKGWFHLASQQQQWQKIQQCKISKYFRKACWERIYI